MASARNLEHIHELFDTCIKDSRISFVSSVDDLSLVVEDKAPVGLVCRSFTNQRRWLFFHRNNKSVNVLDKQMFDKVEKV
jgi:hypothetical protein